MVSAATQVSLLRRHGGHSPNQLISLSLVEAVDRWSTLSLSIAGQLIQHWWPPCNFLMAQSHAACSMRITSSLEAAWTTFSTIKHFLCLSFQAGLSWDFCSYLFVSDIGLSPVSSNWCTGKYFRQIAVIFNHCAPVLRLNSRK